MSTSMPPSSRCKRAAAPLLVALLLSCCSVRPRPSSPAGAAGERAPEPETAALRQALARAIAEPSAQESLRLAVECRREAGFAGARVFGNGIGIWNEERQFRLDPEQIAGLLRTLQEADFLALKDVYGVSEIEVPTPAEPGTSPPGAVGMVTMVTCHLELALGGHVKQALQLNKGEESPVLMKLAEDLLSACEVQAQSGLGASSLRDGLEKIARGELAPEAWVVVLHRRPEADSREAGFLLRVLGSEVSVQAYDPEAGYRAPVVRAMRQEEVRALAAELAARDPGAWPVNLWAAEYTDLSFQVLNRKQSIQARQFAGLEPGTHGQRQQAFDEVFAVLDRLRRTVLDRGEAS